MNENWQKYLLGVAGAAGLALYALTMMVRQQAWVPGSRYIPGLRGTTVTGFGAVSMNLACLGLAAYLFANFYLEKTVQSTRGRTLTFLLEVCAMVSFVVGYGIALWYAFHP